MRNTKREEGVKGKRDGSDLNKKRYPTVLYREVTSVATINDWLVKDCMCIVVPAG